MSRTRDKTEPSSRDYTSILTADSAYRQGRISPRRLEERLDRVEIMSTDSDESTVEDRLRYLEEGPGTMGVPKPWSMRSPRYDKPLPVPQRTPSPMPTPSPTGRRERGSEGGTGAVFASPVMAASPSPVRVLFPQDQLWEEMMAVDGAEEGREMKTQGIKHLTVQELFESVGGETTKAVHGKQPSPRLFTASPATKQHLLDVYHADDHPRGPTPIGLAHKIATSPAPKSLIRTITPVITPIAAPPTTKKQQGTVQKPATTSRPLTPFTLADMLYPMPGSPTGHTPSISSTSPATKMMDLAERGESDLMATTRVKTKADRAKPTTATTRRRELASRSLPQRNSGEFFAGSELQSLPRKGNNLDWQTDRRYPVDRFFNPHLFDLYPTTRKAVKRSAKPHPQKGRKDDWQVTRRYQVDHYFTPQLFQIGPPDYSVVVPRKGRKWDWQVQRKHFVHHYFVPRRFHHTLAAQHVYTPGDWLRHDWKVERRHRVNHYFNPSLFEEFAYTEPITLFDWYRMDWKVERPFPVDRFFVPALFDSTDGSTTGEQGNTIRLPRELLQEVLSRKQVSPIPSLGSVRAIHASTPDSDMSYSEAVFGRYMASESMDNSAVEHNIFYEDLNGYDVMWTEFAEEHLDDDDNLVVDMAEYDFVVYEKDGDGHKRRLTPDSHSAVEHKRTRSLSPVSSTTFSSLSRSQSPSPGVIDSNLTRQAEPDYSFWDTVLSFGPAAVDHNQMVLEAVSLERGGLPVELTAGIWLSLLGMPMVEALCNVYPYLLASSHSPDTVKMIQYDVERAEEDPEEQQILSNILLAYTVYDPVVGYAPGMLKIVMTLREELTEEQSFAGLVRIYFAWDQRRLVVPGVDGLRESLFMFEEVLVDCLPRLADHLSMNGVSSDSFASSWFHALCFSERLDHDMMTWFLLDGRKAVFSVGLALMAVNERRLLSTDDPEEMHFILLHDILDSHSSETIIDFAHHYYYIDDDELLQILQRDFLSTRRESISEWHSSEHQMIREETEKIMNMLAKVSTRIDSVLSDREHLLVNGQQGQQELNDLHRLCYEQAYRLHLDDNRIIDRQFYDAVSETASSTASDDKHTDRVEQELVDVKMRYAEAMAELDHLRNELAANQRSRR